MKIRKGIRDCIHKQEIRFSTKISKTSVEARPQPTDSWRLQQGVAVGTAGPQVGGQEPGMLPAYAWGPSMAPMGPLHTFPLPSQREGAV